MSATPEEDIATALTAAEAALGPLAQAWREYRDAYKAAMQAEYAAGGVRAQDSFDHQHGPARAATRLVLKMRRLGLAGLLDRAGAR
jgi:hypothetical protein